MRLFPAWEKKAISSQTRLLYTREHVWSEFQAKDTPCTQASPSGHWAAEGLHGSSYRRGLCKKNTRVAFQRKTSSETGVPSLSRVYISRRQLLDSCVVVFERTHKSLIALAPEVWLYPTCEKKAFSSQIRLLNSRENVWSEFQAIETTCTQAGPREYGAAKEQHRPRHRRGLGGKKARVAFQSKPPLGLVFHN